VSFGNEMLVGPTCYLFFWEILCFWLKIKIKEIILTLLLESR
jgi:hypothetical protein